MLRELSFLCNNTKLGRNLNSQQEREKHQGKEKDPPTPRIKWRTASKRKSGYSLMKMHQSVTIDIGRRCRQKDQSNEYNYLRNGERQIWSGRTEKQVNFRP
ncbi:Hypothetical predicted protein [Mytilus galloprovincialis]|uniref:Uncharacterized protein n=1 Tax=Mytilus galloprovincialis TaxID=29158 RepID=A0A8B6F621_MYTGA|nr:Hypothetical predicted protein [Mytilus galloprovincialis]